MSSDKDVKLNNLEIPSYVKAFNPSFFKLFNLKILKQFYSLNLKKNNIYLKFKSKVLIY